MRRGESPVQTSVDPRLVERKLGFMAGVGLDEGLRSTIPCYRETLGLEPPAGVRRPPAEPLTILSEEAEAMLLVAHAAVGGALGAAARNRPRGRALLWVAVGALVSHVVIDLVPHWDYPFAAGWIIGDLAASLAVFGVIAYLVGAPGIVFWGAFVACIPDLEHVLVNRLLPGPVFLSHLDWFPHGEAALVPGVLTQVAVMVLAFTHVIRRRRRAVGAAG